MSSDRGISRKEKEVLEQQRKLAAMLANRSSTDTKGCGGNSGRTGIRTKPPASMSLYPNPAVKAPTTAHKQIQNSAPESSQNTQERLIRSGLKRPFVVSASSILEAARSKAAVTEPPNNVDPAAGKSVTETKDSPKLKRKTNSSNSTSNRLASLVKNVASTDGNDELTSAAFGSNVTPEDFWRNIRDWDFVGDLANQVNEKEETVLSTRKAIPETFISFRHYISLWAPLCLAETRAQLISEIMTSSNQQRSRANLFVPVQVETTWKDSGRQGRGLHTDLTDMDACSVKLLTREQSKDSVPFFANDVCCLIPAECKDSVEILLSGKTVKDTGGTFKRYCLIGHTEIQRKEVNGLILKVSKRKWAQVGKKSMYLLRIGGNVTALREFTALCGVETIPLKRYLLGHHLENKAKSESVTEIGTVAIKKDALLKKMGGVQALGKGFTDYAQKKFNYSQLQAISASAHGYGEGGITLIKGPPGTGKTTTLTAILNCLHIRQYNKYYDEVRRIASMKTGNRQGALDAARKAKPRLLVCAPSNAAVDNIILKIMEDGFVDGSGLRYNPSMIRVGVGQSSAVGSIALETKINELLLEVDLAQVQSAINGYRMELQRITADIAALRRRCHALAEASPWPLGKDWEIRVDEETFDHSGRCFFVNHKDQTTTYECPPPPEPGETQFPSRSMPEYRAFMQRIVKSVESYFSVKSNLERNIIIKGSMESGANHFAMRQSLENHVLNSVHMVMTTLGTAGNRVFEGADRFEVVVVDEAAQSVEPATLSALQLGSRHCVLVGDPQQLPATIFNVSGRNSKYDRSLFQRLEEAGQPVHMLNEQYRMHPKISHFPRHIFYGGNLLDGRNVTKPDYGYPLVGAIQTRVPTLQPLTVLDLDSREERGGTSLANSAEAHLAVHLYVSLRNMTGGLSAQSRVAIITPYSQQAQLLKRIFNNALGNDFARLVEINTVDAFQGREANIVIFSAVRAAGSHGIGFLSDVRRMNVALTRAKHFLFVLARCKSIEVNPYWRDLVEHARESRAVVKVPILDNFGGKPHFGDLTTWQLDGASPAPSSIPQSLQADLKPRPADPRKKTRLH